MMQCVCDRCGSYVGLTGLWLEWIMVDDEWRPKELCRGCYDEIHGNDKSKGVE